MKERAIVLLSGGVDSAVALWWTQKKGSDIIALGFKYKGKPQGECVAFLKLCRAVNVKHKLELDLPISVSSNDAKECNGGKLSVGFIAMRNLIYYSVAASVAEKYDARWLVGGHLRTDSIDFSDASVEYFRQLDKLINYGNKRRTYKIALPFIKYTKQDVIRIGAKMNVPFNITWSCFRNSSKHCGRCHSCVDRAKAFQVAGVVDPVFGAERQNVIANSITTIIKGV